MLFHGFPSVSSGAKKSVVKTLIYVRQACGLSILFQTGGRRGGFCVRRFVGMLSNRFKTLVEEESYLGYRSESIQDPTD